MFVGNGGMVNPDGRMEYVPYEAENPEWDRVNGVVSSAKGPAQTLREALDRAYRSFGGALVSPEGDRIGAELYEWRQAAINAANNAEDDLETALSQVPKTVTRYHWEWVPN